MEKIVMSKAEELAAWDKAGSDLKFMMDREGVDSVIQAKLYHIGVTSIKQFAVLVDDKMELRALLKDCFEVDAAADLASRVKCSKLLVAWESSKARAAKMAEADGEAEARHIPKEMSSADNNAMRSAFEARFGELQDKEVPGRTYIDKKLDEVEKSELKAELLSEVISREEDEPDSLKTVWSPSGELKAVKIGAKVSLPSDTEGLRKRLTLLGTTWIFVASHQANRGYLRGLAPALFQEYLAYLLGDYVLGMVASDSRGTATNAPSWNLLVSYEHAIRTRAVHLTRKGMLFSTALKTAWEDPLTKERHFTTPLAMEAIRHRQGAQVTHIPVVAPNNWDEPPSKKAKKTGGKGGNGKGGKNKGSKGKGKNEKGNKDIRRKTANGKPVCFHFNKAHGCDRNPCSYEHVCGRCLAVGVSMIACTCPPH
jgi:hypothetical protein